LGSEIERVRNRNNWGQSKIKNKNNWGQSKINNL